MNNHKIFINPLSEIKAAIKYDWIIIMISKKPDNREECQGDHHKLIKRNFSVSVVTKMNTLN